ncbi:MAG: nuclear transport factor 2 family protein [Caulobacterales bacterium]
MTLDEMLAREAIRHTVSIYNKAVDERNYDELRRVFTADAVMSIQDGPTLTGPEHIIETLRAGAGKRAAAQTGNFQRHCMAAPMIEMLGPRRAMARHYITVITELGLDHSGTYDDEYQQEGERWLISRRFARMEWANPNSRFVRWLGAAKPGGT